MPVYDYKGLTPDGSPRAGIVDADSPREARNKLSAQNILPTAVTERRMDVAAPAADRAARGAPLLRFKRGPKGRREIPTTTRQLATLLKSGVPLAQALSALVEQCAVPDLEAALRDVRERVTSGLSFAEALAYHPAYFDDLYVNMVKAGEASGSLDGVLSRLADYLHKQAQIRSRIAAALAYPIVMLCVGFVIVIILMTFVVPKITQVVKQSGQQLPWMTQVLEGGAHFVEAWWWLMFLAVIVLAIAHRASLRRPEYRYFVDQRKLKLPILGGLFQKAAVSRFAVSMSTLLKSGVPVLESLKIVKDIVNNAVMAKVLDTVHDRIVEGTDIATPIKRSGVFPPVVGYMVAIGEQSGQLEELLDRLAEAYDEEVRVQTEKVTSLLEPILIVCMAAVVGFIVISIMLPILKVSDITRIRGR